MFKQCAEMKNDCIFFVKAAKLIHDNKVVLCFKHDHLLDTKYPNIGTILNKAQII